MMNTTQAQEDRINQLGKACFSMADSLGEAGYTAGEIIKALFCTAASLATEADANKSFCAILREHVIFLEKQNGPGSAIN